MGQERGYRDDLGQVVGSVFCGMKSVGQSNLISCLWSKAISWGSIRLWIRGDIGGECELGISRGDPGRGLGIGFYAGRSHQTRLGHWMKELG